MKYPVALFVSRCFTKSHFIAIANQEVELEASKQSHNDEGDYRIGCSNHRGVIADRMRRQCTTGDKRNIWLSLIEAWDGEEGETRDIDEEACANDKPHTKTTEVLFANDGKLTTGNAGPNGGNQ